MFFSVMALVLALSGISFNLANEYVPPLELKGGYVCGLIDLKAITLYRILIKNDILFNIEIPLDSYEFYEIC